MADIIEEIADETADEIADEIEEIAEESAEDSGGDVVIIEAPEPPEPEAVIASVDVGDLHISGPAEMVEKVTKLYLSDHLDHNPHGEPHTPNILLGENGEIKFSPEYVERMGGPITEVAAEVTPEVVQEQIQESAAADMVDAPPGPTDWLFRERGGR